jgi:hypothetical protein
MEMVVQFGKNIGLWIRKSRVRIPSISPLFRFWGRTMKFRHLPTIIKAAHWDGTDRGYRDLCKLLGHKPLTSPVDETGVAHCIMITILDCPVFVPAGNWIARDVDGKLFPISDELMAKTYEEER